MLSIIIIEDDFAFAQILLTLLKNIDPGIKIKAVINTVKDGIKYFRDMPEVDLILSDIKLKDGLSFSIFEDVQLTCPVIFISTYDKYLINVFKHNSIDYLIKPVSEESLRHAIRKFQKLEKHFIEKNTILKNFVDKILSVKNRLLVTKGSITSSILLSDVVYFIKENFAVSVFDNQGKKYFLDKSLTELEEELDKHVFFRANRQYILNVNYVTGYKSFDRVKLLVKVGFNDKEIEVIISQEKTRSFKKWYAGG